MRRLVSTAVIAAIGVLTASSDALASAFAIRENCAEGLGTVFAGAGSLADNACTVFNNPAGMTRLDGNQFEVGATPVFGTVDFHGSLVGGAGGYSNNNGDNAARPALIPDIYGVYHLTPDLAAGIAVTSPFGLPIKYNSAWVGRYNVIQAEAESVDINPNLAYKINDKLSVAGGLSAQYLTFELSTAINQAFLGSTDALARFKGDNWAIGYNLGVLWSPMTDTRVGLTYRSKIDHKLSGDFNFLNLNPALGGALVSGASTAGIDVPATVGASVTHDLSPQWTMALDVQYTLWSAFKGVGLAGPTPFAFNESYVNSWFTSIGAIYHPDGEWRNWTLRSGIGWDQSPVQNGYRDPAVPDNDRYMVGAGFGYKWSEHTTFDFAYAHYFATHASVTGSVNSMAGLAGVPASNTTFSGNYSLSLDYVSASVTWKF
jgi:long-chain fatty acid transport protein